MAPQKLIDPWVESPEGASTAKPAFRAFRLKAKPVTKRDLANQECNLNSEQEEKNIPFLDQELTPDEYREICQNLGEYFSILKSWQKRRKLE
ncbi:MAG: hypothetical protein AB1442_04980 [Nitrospirota bacterium]